jgi:hypothetical protein
LPCDVFGKLGKDPRARCTPPAFAKVSSGSGRVDVNAHGVDAVLDYRIERARKSVFAEIVLILAHADRSGINLDKLGERVLKPPCDRYRSAQGHV